MLALMGKLETPYAERKKLVLLYDNLKHEVKSYLWAKSYRTVEEFIHQAISAEDTIESKSRYKPPPAPEHSVLPAMAPKLEGQNSKPKFIEKPKVAFDTHSIAVEVAAILQESVLGVREIKTGKDARGNADYDSEYSSASFGFGAWLLQVKEELQKSC